MSKFEYVPKGEYQPIRRQLEGIIHRVQHTMREKYHVTFQYQLIGSGSRHLITREKGGNRGFDFDYDLIVQSPVSRKSTDLKDLKDRFRRAFIDALKGTNYRDPEDSTSVLTIKVVDTKSSRIVHSCDFCIVFPFSDGGKGSLKNQKNGRYSIERRPASRNIDHKLAVVLSTSGGWNRIRANYLRLKENNRDPQKRSFVLYMEAVCNIYNQIKQETTLQNASQPSSDCSYITCSRPSYSWQEIFGFTCIR